MKSSERINLENGGVFLRSLIEIKMCSSQTDECMYHLLYYIKLVLFIFIILVNIEHFFRFKNTKRR